MSTSFLVVDVTLRRTLSPDGFDPLSKTTRNPSERFGPEMFTEREGGRKKQRPQSQTIAAAAGSCCFFLISSRLFQLTTRYRRSRVRERASESETIAPSVVPLSTAEWSLDLSQPTDGPTRPGPRLRPPPALPPDGSPFPLRAYALLRVGARGEPMRPNDEFGCQMKSARPSSSSKEREGHSKPQR